MPPRSPVYRLNPVEPEFNSYGALKVSMNPLSPGSTVVDATWKVEAVTVTVAVLLLMELGPAVPLALSVIFTQ